MERHESDYHRVAVEANESAAVEDAAVSVSWLIPRDDASVVAFSLFGTHVMIHMWVDCLRDMKH